MTQCEKILNYIEDHGSITARQAYKLGIMRLASRISDLRREGHLIKTEDIKVKNRDGSHSYIAKYSLIEKEVCSEV